MTLLSGPRETRRFNIERRAAEKGNAQQGRQDSRREGSARARWEAWPAAECLNLK